MTTPKWMLGLVACVALLVASNDSDKESNDDCGCSQASVKVDEE